MLAARATLVWARLYTSGMPEELRRARLDELASDLWEHCDCASSAGNRRAAIQLEVASRTARGLGADLAWRAANRVGLVGAALRAAGWAGFALSTASLLFFTGSSGAPVLGVYAVTDWEPGDARQFARVTAAIFVALAVGLGLLRARPLVGTGLIAAAGGGLALYVTCLWALFVPLALAATAGAGVIARRQRRAARREPVATSARR
jgi:hypothetical protein